MTEGRESAFAGLELFASGGVARFLTRDEVVLHPEKKEWVFAWVDDLLMQVEPFRKHLAGNS